MKKSKQKEILKKLWEIKNEYHLYYLDIYFTNKGNLIFKDLEGRNRTLKNSEGKLLHNKVAINWLLNEAIADTKYDKELEEIKEEIK